MKPRVGKGLIEDRGGDTPNLAIDEFKSHPVSFKKTVHVGSELFAA